MNLSVGMSSNCQNNVNPSFSSIYVKSANGTFAKFKDGQKLVGDVLDLNKVGKEVDECIAKGGSPVAVAVSGVAKKATEFGIGMKDFFHNTQMILTGKEADRYNQVMAKYNNVSKHIRRKPETQLDRALDFNSSLDGAFRLIDPKNSKISGIPIKAVLKDNEAAKSIQMPQSSNLQSA